MPAIRSTTRPSSSSITARSEEHTSELQSRRDLVCRLLLEKKKYPECFKSNGRVAPIHQIDIKLDHIIKSGILRRQVFFFNDTATTEIYTLSLHDALPI